MCYSAVRLITLSSITNHYRKHSIVGTQMYLCVSFTQYLRGVPEYHVTKQRQRTFACRCCLRHRIQRTQVHLIIRITYFMIVDYEALFKIQSERYIAHVVAF